MQEARRRIRMKDEGRRMKSDATRRTGLVDEAGMANVE
jgi:hypothetical protein